MLGGVFFASIYLFEKLWMDVVNLLFLSLYYVNDITKNQRRAKNTGLLKVFIKYLIGTGLALLFKSELQHF